MHDHALHKVDVRLGRSPGRLAGFCSVLGKRLVAGSRSTRLNDRRCRYSGLLRQGSCGTKDNDDGGDGPKCGENQVRHVPPTMMQRGRNLQRHREPGSQQATSYLRHSNDPPAQESPTQESQVQLQSGNKRSLFARQSNCLNINTSLIPVQSAFIRRQGLIVARPPIQPALSAESHLSWRSAGDRLSVQ